MDGLDIHPLKIINGWVGLVLFGWIVIDLICFNPFSMDCKWIIGPFLSNPVG